MNRYSRWDRLVAAVVVLIGLLAVLSGCSRSSTSIVGKWADTRVGENAIEFRSDGTARLDADWDKMYATLVRLNPGKEERVRATVAQRRADIDNLNRAGVTWTQSGDDYLINLPNGQCLFRYRRSGDALVSVNGGKPGLEFRRVN